MKSLSVISLFGICLFIIGSGCSGQSVSVKAVLGNYDVTVSQSGKSDTDVMSISTGSNGTVLIQFIAGIFTDATGPNPTGLRASVGGGNTLTIAKQPAHIEHSTGILNGTIFGDGKVTVDMINMTLHYLPTNFAVNQMEDPDGGGVVLTRPDGGSSGTLDYAVTGTREM